MHQNNFIQTSHLSYQINNRMLINNVSLQLPCGSFSVIIGPNGAGKTTLLRLLTGYLKPSSGQCLLLSKEIQNWRLAELTYVRAVMRQLSEINFPFSIKEIIMMGGHNKPSKVVASLLDKVMQQSEITHLALRDYPSLSGGEKQRVQLAKALLQIYCAQLSATKHTPNQTCIFLDEPTSALDLHHQQHTLRLLKQLSVHQGITICCILHDLNIASLYADQLFLLHQGQLVAAGDPTSVLTKEVITTWYKAELGINTHHIKNDAPQIYLYP